MYVEAERNRLKLYMREYDPAANAVLKNELRATFRPASTRDTAHWTLPLNVRSANAIVRAFGRERVKLHPELRAKLNEKATRERQLSALAVGTGAELSRLPHVLPVLFRALYAGPRGKGLTDEELDDVWLGEEGSYQLNDVAYGALAGSFLNGNKPGLGKTLEYIGIIYEAGIENGKHLIIAPTSSLETVWLDELERWQPLPVWVARGSAEERNEVINSFMLSDEPGFLAINPAMVRLIETIERCSAHLEKATKVQMRKCDKCVVSRRAPYPELFNVQWTTVNVDECHKAAMRNPQSLTYEGLDLLRAERRIAQSGTPGGGREVNLFPILHWLNSDEYSSKWAWAAEWLEITEEKVGRTATRRNIGNLRSDRADQFYQAHAPIILRRTKEECLPWLPPKDRIDIWCEMTPKQAKQYQRWAEDAEVKIDGQRLSALSVLDEYTRLKQFAFSLCDITLDGDILPTVESGVLLSLRDKLDELGIYDEDCDEQVVIFSQFTSVVDLVAGWLTADGVPTATITGKVTGNVRGLRDDKGRKVSKRAHLSRKFQAGEIRVMVLNTAAGGVAINLDRANTVMFLDETWDPDDQEQAEDRVQRGTTLHQVTCLYFRTRGTIQELVRETNITKFNVNHKMLDEVRQRLSRTRVRRAYEAQ